MHFKYYLETVLFLYCSFVGMKAACTLSTLSNRDVTVGCQIQKEGGSLVRF